MAQELVKAMPHSAIVIAWLLSIVIITKNNLLAQNLQLASDNASTRLWLVECVCISNNISSSYPQPDVPMQLQSRSTCSPPVHPQLSGWMTKLCYWLPLRRVCVNTHKTCGFTCMAFSSHAPKHTNLWYVRGLIRVMLIYSNPPLQLVG
ncbi:hypothetical protein K431DRAFT_19613 [Polychaeton citri CBS 116435]|uniref:Uncharacterized protein n=1 Tax=Polychaeton citri CBS 116435 TaxID=1314669 RepID=A0A9P4Q0T8_9PEZI|nr:hypothetical protein K431DRAFT_19613 [Polychaeton citri CBS 116435]